MLVHTNAREGLWGHVQEFGLGASVTPVTFPDVVLRVSSLFEE